MELRVGGKYKFSKRLGAGAFGDIYCGVNIKSGEEVAIKLELLKTTFPQLQYEAKLYRIFQGQLGFSQVHYFGVEGDFNVMVIDILGPNLQRMFEYCEERFSLKTICMMAIQCVARMETLHDKGFIHRDIKPENFLMGVGKKSHIVYAIDFGLAKRYLDPRTGNHIQFKEDKGMTGTARYASANAQIGNEQSRRDDLEAIAFMLAYFIRDGHLPWMGIKAKRSQKGAILAQLKKETTSEDLLAGKPQEFVDYLNYVRNLQFDERPNYTYLKKLFENLMVKHGYEMDYEYDWVIKKQAITRELQPQTLEQQQQQDQQDIEEQKQAPSSRRLTRGLVKMNSLDTSVSSGGRGGSPSKIGRLSTTLERKRTQQLAPGGVPEYVDPKTAQQKERADVKQRRKERLVEALDVESGKIAKPPNPFTRALSIDQGSNLISSFATRESKASIQLKKQTARDKANESPQKGISQKAAGGAKELRTPTKSDVSPSSSKPSPKVADSPLKKKSSELSVGKQLSEETRGGSSQISLRKK